MSDSVIDRIAIGILTGVVIGVLSIIVGYIKDFKKKAERIIKDRKLNELERYKK